MIDKPIEELVQDVHKGALAPVDVLHTYGKIAIKAQERCNCITELLIPESEEWAKSGINLQGLLPGQFSSIIRHSHEGVQIDAPHSERVRLR